MLKSWPMKAGIRLCIQGVDTFQLRDVVQDSARDDAVLPIHDAALLATGLRRNVVLDRNAVVHLAVLEEVTQGDRFQATSHTVLHLRTRTRPLT